MDETTMNLRNIYQSQVDKLKADWKSGKSEYCSRTYKIQLGIWERRIKEYNKILDE